MEFSKLLQIVGDEPVFETGLLLAGNVDPKNVRRQISRWVKAGQLFQLRRGLYALAPPFQKMAPHPFLVANRMVRGAYVTTQAALAYYGLIPEYVPVVTSVTPARPAQWSTPLGRFVFHHVKTDWLRGYHLVDVASNQQAFVATPEKALLDLVYLQPGGDSAEYIHALRLQNLDQLNLSEMADLAASVNRPKLQRAVDVVADLIQNEDSDYEAL